VVRVRLHLLIKGKVQGVFFRQSMRDVAKHYGVHGWVRNLPDGRTVEAVLEGDEEAVNKVVEWARYGPPGARVESIDATREEYRGEFDDFKILPTPKNI